MFLLHHLPSGANEQCQGYNSVYSTDSAEESERERVRKTSLGKLARKRFEAMLRAMSGKRGELARCMAFSLEHAEAATEVSYLSPEFVTILNVLARLPKSFSPRFWWKELPYRAKLQDYISSVTYYITQLPLSQVLGSLDKSSKQDLVLFSTTCQPSTTLSRGGLRQRLSRNRSRLLLIFGRIGSYFHQSLRLS